MAGRLSSSSCGQSAARVTAPGARWRGGGRAAVVGLGAPGSGSGSGAGSGVDRFVQQQEAEARVMAKELAQRQQMQAMMQAEALALAASKGLPPGWLVYPQGGYNYRIVAPDGKTYRSLIKARAAVNET